MKTTCAICSLILPNSENLRNSVYSVTALGDEVDFVSRTLIPHVQQLEDPATGSSHAALTPFWRERLKKDRMVAHQLSKRGGKFVCEMENEQVKLTGSFSMLAKGELM